MTVCSVLVDAIIFVYERMNTSKSLLRKGFDLLRNSPSTVSIYADECELLVLTALLTSARLSKNKSFDSLNRVCCFHNTPGYWFEIQLILPAVLESAQGWAAVPAEAAACRHLCFWKGTQKCFPGS